MTIWAVIQIAALVITTGYSAYNAYQMRKKAQKDAAGAPSPIPYISEADVIPVVFGTVSINGTNIVEAIGPNRREDNVEIGAGYRGDLKWWEWNFVRIILCHGKIDSVKIYSEGKFVATVTGDTAFDFDAGDSIKYAVFGEVRTGSLTQLPSPTTMPSGLSDLNWQGGALRHPGIAYVQLTRWLWNLSFKDVWQQKPQYPDVLTWRVQRINWRHGETGIVGWFDDAQWQPSLAMITPVDPAIFPQMNPAHIIREVLTDRVWGLGLNSASIDETSFVAAATTLHSEKFGLSFLWAQESSAADFIAEILRHIDGLLYQEPSTGNYVLKLIREDSNALFVLDSSSSVVAAPEVSRKSHSELVTRVSVIYRVVWNNADRTDEALVAVHDLALASELGDVPVTIRYDGVYDANLANRIAARDLRRLSTPLATVRLSLSWSAGKDIRAGDRIRWTWSPYGITTMPLRVVAVTYGELDATTVALECIEDVLAPATALYSQPQPSAYLPPNYTPVASQPYAIEAPFALAAFGAAGIGTSDTRGSLLVAAPRPAIRPTLHTAWDLAVDGVTRGTDLRFTDTFTTTSALTFSGLGNGVSANLNFTASFVPTVGATYLCALERPDGTGEIVTLFVSTATFGTMSRGTYDTTVYYGTVPSGTVLHVIGNTGALSPTNYGLATDGRAYVVASAVSSRALTRTSQEVLPFASALADSVTMANRQIRPTCPGFVSATFASGTGTTITWRRRNRLTNPTCTQTCPDVTPETGTTHRLIIEGLSAATGGVFVQVQNLTLASTVTSYLYTKKNEEDDHAALPGPAAYFDQLRLTLYSTRDGYDSWQRQIRVRT